MTTNSKAEIRRPIRPALLTIAAVGALAFSALHLAGCNTTEGVGKDIEAVGDGISDAASSAKD